MVPLSTILACRRHKMAVFTDHSVLIAVVLLWLPPILALSVGCPVPIPFICWNVLQCIWNSDSINRLWIQCVCSISSVIIGNIKLPFVNLSVRDAAPPKLLNQCAWLKLYTKTEVCPHTASRVLVTIAMWESHQGRRNCSFLRLIVVDSASVSQPLFQNGSRRCFSCQF